MALELIQLILSMWPIAKYNIHKYDPLSEDIFSHVTFMFPYKDAIIECEIKYPGYFRKPNNYKIEN